MSAREVAAEVLPALANRGLDEVELYVKSGRSRRFEVGPHGRASGASQESGWAIRAGNDRGSLFVAGTGEPSAESDWPSPDGRPLRLPAAKPIPAWRAPADLDASLAAEREVFSLLEGVERGLVEELPGARLLRGVLDEGTSEAEVVSSRGVDIGYRARAAGLYVEAVGPWPEGSSTSLLLAEREVRSFQPATIAKRLANRLLLDHRGRAPAMERGEMLVSSVVAARLVAGLRPLLIGAEGTELARQYRDRQGRIAGSSLTVLDNGRLAGGVLEAPADGEGMPTGTAILIERGKYCQPLVSWRQKRPSLRSTVGCVRRDSWREPPQLAPSHLYIEPQFDISVASLVGSVARGYYLVEPTGHGRFALEEDHFHLPVCGFVLRRGAAMAPLAHARLEGSIRSLLQGIQAVARDLYFEPIGGMVGSPTLLVTGVSLRG